MIISEHIFTLMREQGISQKELSDKTGISQSTISDWKRKKTNPSADKLHTICDALHITLNELLGDTGGGDIPAGCILVEKGSEEYNFLMEYRTLPQKYKERLKGYLSALKDVEEKR